MIVWKRQNYKDNKRLNGKKKKKGLLVAQGYKGGKDE